MKICILSSSLNKKSRSLVMSRFAATVFESKGVETDVINLKKFDLPFCDGDHVYKNENVRKLKSRIKACQGIIIATPIYNYDANAVIKNVIELTGSAWEDKTVGFLCKAGGQKSYMSIMGLANSLMLDFRCVIIPRFVYALSSSFDKENEELVDNKIKERIEELCKKVIQITAALKTT